MKLVSHLLNYIHLTNNKVEYDHTPPPHTHTHPIQHHHLGIDGI